jgi:hypothetical protein
VLALVQPQSSFSDGPNNLRPTYDRVQICTKLESSTNDDDCMLVILDDITILEWIGFPLIDFIFRGLWELYAKRFGFLQKKSFQTRSDALLHIV